MNWEEIKEILCMQLVLAGVLVLMGGVFYLVATWPKVLESENGNIF